MVRPKFFTRGLQNREGQQIGKNILSFAKKSDAIKKTQMANANRYPSVIYDGLCWFHSVF